MLSRYWCVTLKLVALAANVLFVVVPSDQFTTRDRVSVLELLMLPVTVATSFSLIVETGLMLVSVAPAVVETMTAVAVLDRRSLSVTVKVNVYVPAELGVKLKTGVLLEPTT